MRSLPLPGGGRTGSRPGGGGLQGPPPRPGVAYDPVRDRAPGEGDLEHLAARRLDRLADGLAPLVRLPGGDADVPLPVPDGDQRIEAEPAPAFHDLRDPVDGDHVLDQPVAFPLALARVAALAAPPTTATPASTTAARATRWTVRRRRRCLRPGRLWRRGSGRRGFLRR